MAQINLVNRSGTITTGGTAQQLTAANDSRLGWSIQNTSATDLWVSDVGTASAGGTSYKVPAGTSFTPPAVALGVISIFGATTAQSFAAREW